MQVPRPLGASLARAVADQRWPLPLVAAKASSRASSAGRASTSTTEPGRVRAGRATSPLGGAGQRKHEGGGAKLHGVVTDEFNGRRSQRARVRHAATVATRTDRLHIVPVWQPWCRRYGTGAAGRPGARWGRRQAHRHASRYVTVAPAIRARPFSARTHPTPVDECRR